MGRFSPTPELTELRQLTLKRWLSLGTARLIQPSPAATVGSQDEPALVLSALAWSSKLDSSVWGWSKADSGPQPISAPQQATKAHE